MNDVCDFVNHYYLYDSLIINRGVWVILRGEMKSYVVL